MPIEVKIEEPIPASIARWYLEHYRGQQEAFLNDFNQFTARDRLLTCLHEAGHVFAAHANNATGIEIKGPQVYYDNFEKSLAFAPATVYWDPLPPTTSVNSGIRIYIQGFVFRERLTDSLDEESAIDNDTACAREWYNESIGLGEESFLLTVETTKEEIIRDLRSPAFRRAAWDEARRIQREIFPSDN